MSTKTCQLKSDTNFSTALKIPFLDNNDLCVNVDKSLNATDIEDYVKTSRAGAIWIPAQLLEIVPYQPVQGLLPPSQTNNMLKYANRAPIDNASLIVQEGLEKLMINDKNVGTIYSVLIVRRRPPDELVWPL